MSDIKNYTSPIYDQYLTTTYAPQQELNDKVIQYKANQYAHYFGAYLPSNKAASILEVGCGPGGFLLCCQQLGYTNTVGIDLSPQMVAFCHQHGFTQVFCVDVLTYLNDCAEQFDLVVMSDVLEHLTKPEVLATLRLIYQNLNVGGRIIIRVPNLSNPFNNHTQYGDFTHETAFTTKSLQQVLQVSGFAIESIHGELTLYSHWLERLFFDQLLWRAFQFFFLHTMHLDQDVIRGKNLIAVGIKTTKLSISAS